MVLGAGTISMVLGDGTISMMFGAGTISMVLGAGTISMVLGAGTISVVLGAGTISMFSSACIGVGGKTGTAPIYEEMCSGIGSREQTFRRNVTICRVGAQSSTDGSEEGTAEERQKLTALSAFTASFLTKGRVGGGE
jgi:hypothetical protein